MLEHHDATAIVDQPKSVRMEQRTKPHVKAQIQLAAALLGMDETTFVTSAAYDRACAAIRDHERTVLSESDRDVLLAALDSPVAPTEALRGAMALRREQTAHAE